MSQKKYKDLEKVEKVTYLLGRLWVLRPSQRLFQLLYNYTELGYQHIGMTDVKDVYNYTDEKLIKELKKAIKKVSTVTKDGL